MRLRAEAERRTWVAVIVAGSRQSSIKMKKAAQKFSKTASSACFSTIGRACLVKIKIQIVGTAVQRFLCRAVGWKRGAVKVRQSVFCAAEIANDLALFHIHRGKRKSCHIDSTEKQNGRTHAQNQACVLLLYMDDCGRIKAAG